MYVHIWVRLEEYDNNYRNFLNKLNKMESLKINVASSCSLWTSEINTLFVICYFKNLPKINRLYRSI